MDDAIVVSRAIHFAAIALLLGAPLFRLAIVPDGGRVGWPGGRTIELAAALAAFLSGLGWYAGVAATMAGSWADAASPDILGAVTFDTRFGHLWIGRLVVLAALVVVQAAMAPWRRRDVVLVLLAVGFAGSLVGVGHGMTGAGHGVAAARIHMAADVTHLLCAFAWIGGLFGLGQLVRAAMTEKTSPDAVRVALERFSGAGYWVVALLLITGCINAFVMVPRPDSLLTSDYGRVLVVKIVFALMMVAIALLNRIALAPALAGAVTGAPGPAVLRKLWRSVLVEQVVGVLVLIVVARLGTIHPVP